MRTHFFLLLSYKSVLCTAFVLLLFSCAQMQIPGGGARDSTAPKAINYQPDSAAVNFKGNSFHVTFDENIKLKDVSSEFVISPPVQKIPEVKLTRNKTVELTFQEPLKTNTTYSVYFGNAILDVHEGNVAEGFSYVFSTGPVIDSLSLFGTVNEALSGAQLKNVTVMLYAEHYDSIPYKQIPDYFTRSKPDGSYRINNIRPGKYKAFAIQDANRNFLFDSEEEGIAFSDSLLDITKNTKFNFRLFKEERKKQFLKTAKLVEPGKILVVLNKPALDLKIVFGKAEGTAWDIGHNTKADSFFVFFDKHTGDSLVLKLSSLESVWKEDVAIRTTAPGKRTLNARVIYSNAGTQDPDKPVRILYPIDTFNFSGPLNDKNAFGNLNGTELKFDIKKMEMEVKPAGKLGLWEEGKSYLFKLYPGAFTGFGNLKSDSIEIKFKTNEAKFYGNLELKVQVKNGSYIIQLMDDKGKIIHHVSAIGGMTISLPMLSPGNYRARIIFDGNKNGKWDTGNYLKGIQPEKVLYSTGKFNVRSDWDVQEVWKIE